MDCLKNFTVIADCQSFSPAATLPLSANSSLNNGIRHASSSLRIFSTLTSTSLSNNGSSFRHNSNSSGGNSGNNYSGNTSNENPYGPSWKKPVAAASTIAVIAGASEINKRRNSSFAVSQEAVSEDRRLKNDTLVVVSKKDNGILKNENQIIENPSEAIDPLAKELYDDGHTIEDVKKEFAKRYPGSR